MRKEKNRMELVEATSSAGKERESHMKDHNLMTSSTLGHTNDLWLKLIDATTFLLFYS